MTTAIPTQRLAEASPGDQFDPLRRRLTGTLALPGEAAYAELATPWNVAVATRPAAVAAVASADDVVQAVRFAGEAGLPVAVQATGHGIADSLDGALLIHTGRLDECVVHPEGWARVGAGVAWRTVIDAAAAHGLAPLNGSAPGAGAVGYTTGGGLGPMARTYGWASDLVRAFEVVTGDGTLRRATETEEPDLFWGLRGGKGALGVVTAMEFDLVPMTQVYGGALYFDGADAGTVLHAWRRWCTDLPELATTSVALLQLPPLPGVPEPLAGRLTVAVRLVWTGDPAEGEALLRPMREAAPMLVDAVGVMPYTAIGMVHADPEDPVPAADFSDLLRDLPAEAVDTLLGVAGAGSGSPLLVVEIRQLGGAVARPPRVADAICHRDAAFVLVLVGMMVPPIADAVAPHAQCVLAAMEPWATGAVFPNFAPGTGQERLERSYDPATLERLTAVAERYDPGRVLRAGQVPVRG